MEFQKLGNSEQAVQNARAIDVLLPREPAAVYSAYGSAERSGYSGGVISA